MFFRICDIVGVSPVWPSTNIAVQLWRLLMNIAVMYSAFMVPFNLAFKYQILSLTEDQQNYADVTDAISAVCSFRMTYASNLVVATTFLVMCVEFKYSFTNFVVWCHVLYTQLVYVLYVVDVVLNCRYFGVRLNGVDVVDRDKIWGAYMSSYMVGV